MSSEPSISRSCCSLSRYRFLRFILLLSSSSLPGDIPPQLPNLVPYDSWILSVGDICIRGEATENVRPATGFYSPSSVFRRLLSC
ncbi:hypothetical protein BKA82DRAFT_4178645 [Pisolithus tinctorius]|nr:hypothetical protein BKA82DRAFT_4178645 [Pisolithus tinctorius]